MFKKVCHGIRTGVLGVGLMVGLWGSQAVMAESSLTWYNCLTDEVFTPDKRVWCDNWEALQQMTLTVPTSFVDNPAFTTVTLDNGQYQQPDGPLQVLLVNEPNWLTFGDINQDGRQDAAAIVGIVPDGDTVGTYLTVIFDVQGQAQALEPIRLGERILLNGPITVDEDQVMVPQLTQTMVINREFVATAEVLTEKAQFPVPEIVSDGTLLFSQTPRYAVRVFTEAGQAYINLFDKTADRTALSGASTIPQSSPMGMIYSYRGTGIEPSVDVQVAPTGDQTLQIDDSLEAGDRLDGRITYRPRMALPPNAVLEIALEDVSRADAPAVTLASQTLVLGERQVPVPFQLMYDSEQIDPRFTYALRARISVDGELRFINTTSIPVITRDNPTTDIEVLVDPVR